MRLISPLLKHVVYPGLAKAGYFRRSNRAELAVITYHGVMPAGYRTVDPELDGSLVSAELLRGQLQLLKNHYNVISPREFMLWREEKQDLPLGSVMLTCDDGLANTLTEMLSILQEMDLSCLFFVTGASLSETASMLWYEELYLMFLAAPESITLEMPGIGMSARAAGQREKRSLWWNLVRVLSGYELSERRAMLAQIRFQLGLREDWNEAYLHNAESRRRFLMLNLPELRKLASAGMFIGAHTLSHPLLAESSDDLSWREISESRNGLEQALSTPIWALAYPFGDPGSITRREIGMAERAGYQCAFLNVGGGFGAEESSFAWPRVHITSNMSLGEFEAHVSGFYRSARKFMGVDAGIAG